MRLQQKLTRLKHCLKEWNKTVFGNVFDNVVAAENGGSRRQMRHMIRSLATARLWSAIGVLLSWFGFWPRRRLFGGRRRVLDGPKMGSETRDISSLVQKRRFRGTIFGIQHEGGYLTDPIAIKDSAASFFQRLLTAEPVFPEEMDSEHWRMASTDEDRRFLCVMRLWRRFGRQCLVLILIVLRARMGLGQSFFILVGRSLPRMFSAQ
ncbi:UNVERIFIED_CONTAM: hypothetical protein Sangu_2900000 [Sesamum angustifolium]|uniref:Uncharacterized protein n=1 Tax=Sesamum angustifolium TaxID=2727405 RepID=A0AAW2IMI7_9LAMI